MFGHLSFYLGDTTDAKAKKAAEQANWKTPNGFQAGPFNRHKRLATQ